MVHMSQQSEMSLSSQLKMWLAPPEKALGGQKLSLDRYVPSTRLIPTASVISKGTDLESQSSSSTGEKRRPASLVSRALSHGSPDRRSLKQRIKAWKPSKEILYNAILGTSDGMTVPFAVTASLAGVTDAKLVMMAGLAELIGGAISMAAGGVLGARTDVQKYQKISADLAKQVTAHPSTTEYMIAEAFQAYLPAPTISALSTHISSRDIDTQLDFLLRFTPRYHSPDPPTTAGVWKIALVLGLGYFSGLVPLLPYMVVEKHKVSLALYVSVGVTAVALAVFGYGKTMLCLDGYSRPLDCFKGSLECLLVVGVSAGLSVLIIRGIGGTL